MRTSYSRCSSLSFFIPSLSWEQKTKPTHSPYLHQHLKRSTTGLHIPRISSPLLALQDPATNREFNGAESVRRVMEVGEINAAGLLWLCGWDEILVLGADGFGVKGLEEERRKYLKKSWPGGPIIVFKIITKLPLNTSVCCLKTGRRWFQNYHFKHGFLNNVF